MRTRLASAALLLVLASLPLAAQSNDLGLWAAAGQVGDTTSEGVTIDFDDARGFGASLNHFWSDHLSTELGAMALRSDDGGISIDGQRLLSTGELKLIPITAAVQWHFNRHARFDPYVGAGVAYVLTDDLQSSELDAVDIGTVEIDDGIGWVVGAGGTFALSSRFGVAVDAKYIRFRPDSGPPGDSIPLDLDPLVISAGIRLRW
jgi:outer membrane protein W